jgi:hypothetical protein
MLLKLQSSIRKFNHIWQYFTYEIRKILGTLSFHVVGNCGGKKNCIVFWQFFESKKIIVTKKKSKHFFCKLAKKLAKNETTPKT